MKKFALAAALVLSAGAALAAPAVTATPVPEPEVFAMMLLGLCLIGYRATRDSDEKFSNDEVAPPPDETPKE